MIPIPKIHNSRIYSDFLKLSLTVLIFFGIPIFEAKREMWDGTMVEYNLSQKDFTALRNWFFESGWELQYFVLRIQDLLSHAFQLPFRSLVIGLSVALLLATSMEIYLLSQNVFKLSREYSLASGLIFVILPIWNVLITSATNIHIMCLYFGIMGTRIYYNKNIIFKFIGLLLIIFSFQLNSLLLFIPSLIFAINLVFKNEIKKSILDPNLLVIIGASTTYYILKKLFNPNYGLYENYNEITLPSTFAHIRAYVDHLFTFSTFLFIPLSAILIHKMLRNSLFRQETTTRKLCSTHNKILFFLFITAILPYIMVDKSTALYDIQDWGQRHAIILSVPLAILTSSIMNSVSNLIEWNRKEFKFNNLTFILISILPITLLLSSFAIKINRQIFEEDLRQSLLSLKVDDPKPGLLQINGIGIPGPSFRNYESNYFTFLTYGEPLWWTLIQVQPDIKFGYPKDIPAIYLNTYIFKPTENSCTTSILIRAKGYKNPIQNVIKRNLRIIDSEIIILEYNTSCSNVTDSIKF